MCVDLITEGRLPSVPQLAATVSFAVFLTVSESPPTTLSCKLLACAGRVSNMQRNCHCCYSLLAWHCLVLLKSCKYIFLGSDSSKNLDFVLQCIAIKWIFPPNFSLYCMFGSRCVSCSFHPYFLHMMIKFINLICDILNHSSPRIVIFYSYKFTQFSNAMLLYIHQPNFVYITYWSLFCSVPNFDDVGICRITEGGDFDGRNFRHCSTAVLSRRGESPGGCQHPLGCPGGSSSGEVNQCWAEDL